MKGAAAIGGSAGLAMMNAGRGIAGMTAKGAAESAGTVRNIGGGTADAPQKSGSSGHSESSQSNSNSKVTGDLGNEGGNSGGRAAHDGKPFYNLPNLTKEENQALNELQKNAPSRSYVEAAKIQFGKLQGMRKDNYNPKAIQNQIEHINKQFGTNLKTGKSEGDE